MHNFNMHICAFYLISSTIIVVIMESEHNKARMNEKNAQTHTFTHVHKHIAHFKNRMKQDVEEKKKTIKHTEHRNRLQWEQRERFNTDGVMIMLHRLRLRLSISLSVYSARKIDVCKIVRVLQLQTDSSFISHRSNRFCSIGNETMDYAMWSIDFT